MNSETQLQIELVDAATAELHSAVTQLISELSSSAPPLTYDAFEALLAHDAIDFFVARTEGAVVGMLTLATFPIPTGTRAWIEDVVVSPAARGTGAGSALVRAAIDRAQQLGARTVDLTSRPSREAANRLYLKLGFQPRETNVYRFTP